MVVNARGVVRLRSGHPWIYRSDVVSSEGAGPGALVEIKSERGRFLGTAFYSTASEIALRLVSSEKIENLAELVRERVRQAAEYRKKIVRDSDAYRVVFSEADQLPGLIVDRYNDVLVLEALTQATDDRELKQAVVAELVERLAPAGIAERAEPRIRQLEQLPPLKDGLLHGDKAETVFTMNGLRFRHRALAGQKTGAFLDQRENYAAAAAYAHGDALDVFCYQGGFALHMARVCPRVTGVDSSRPALESAEENASLNAGLPEIEWIEANAFDLLKDYACRRAPVRHHRPRSACFCSQPPRPANRASRLQRAEPAGPEDAAPGRDPGHLFLLLPRRGGRICGNVGRGSHGRAPLRPHPRETGTVERPPHRAHSPRNQLLKVRDCCCKLLIFK